MNTQCPLVQRENERQSDLDLATLRHSCAHLLAMAVKELYPSAKLALGPAIEDGFYYDFSMDEPLSSEALEKIETQMRNLTQQDLPIQQLIMTRDEALLFFARSVEPLKIEVLEQIPASATITVYTQGGFADLCRGPHVARTGVIRHFKLTRVSGAYWRGDAKGMSLQRIYGTCWASEQELKEHLRRQEEAQRRDHRRLGVELDYFHFQEEAVGSVFWHPRGWKLFLQLIDYMRSEQDRAGYVEVNTPDVMNRSLWETSGHWKNYRQHMFACTTEDESVYALKPMNCPGAVLLFRQGQKSFRHLPLRLAEFGKVHRYEPSGTLHGLLRVRHFTQDDAHIFCGREQILDECRRIVSFVLNTYRHFGFDRIKIKLSTRPDQRMGSDSDWDFLESTLGWALDSLKLDYHIQAGEGAFYGPKLEFALKDAIGREWQCGTLQVDLNLPESFDLTFINGEGHKERPVMLHRALFGSLERFIGILIEHHAGRLPAWLSPVQIVILSIADRHVDYAAQLVDVLKNHKMRAESDLSADTISNKIRKHSLQKIPFLLIVGDRECAERSVSVRCRSGEKAEALMLDKLPQFLSERISDTHSK